MGIHAVGEGLRYTQPVQMYDATVVTRGAVVGMAMATNSLRYTQHQPARHLVFRAVIDAK